MLQNDLYTVEQLIREGNKLTVLIRVNPLHDIFKGHFPGNPILPGVCIIQILKDILAIHLGEMVVLIKIDIIKFLSFINPEINSKIKFDVDINVMENDIVLCNACLFFESVVFCRFKGSFRIRQVESARH